MSKITNIPSEIRNFFSEKRRSIVMDTFMRLLESLNLDNRSLGGLKRENCQLTNLQVFQILLLLPFFAIKGFSRMYTRSVFLDTRLLCCVGVMAARSSYSTSRFMVRKARLEARNKGL